MSKPVTPGIATHSYHAYLYARDVIQGRWPEGEAVIMQNPLNACLYARDVIQGRWPEAEPLLLTHPTAAILYARKVIKGRFPIPDNEQES